jgi:hypothetical protein
LVPLAFPTICDATVAAVTLSAYLDENGLAKEDSERTEGIIQKEIRLG